LSKNFKSLDELIAANTDKLAEVDSIGPKIAGSVSAFFNKDQNRSVIESLKAAGLQFESNQEGPETSTLEGKTFVLTGSLPTLTRKEATEWIEKHGGKTSSSVSGNTDFLLAGESAGSKLAKAQKLNVPVIDESEFNRLVGRKTD